MKWFTRIALVMVMVVVIVALAAYVFVPVAPEPQTTKIVTIGPTPLDDQIRYAIEQSDL